MYCIIQFYVQLRADLRQHKAGLKIVAIKLVVFLSFWQTFLISIATSSVVNILKPTATIAYPDLKVGIPSLLLCVEMAAFALLHQWAFPFSPYRKGGAKYPDPRDPGQPTQPNGDAMRPVKQGGPLGIKAIGDAMNPWDLIKAFARGMRWLFVGVKIRETDSSYKIGELNPDNLNDMSLQPSNSSYKMDNYKPELPIAHEFRKSNFGMAGAKKSSSDEGAALIAHAQPNPLNPGTPSFPGYVPAYQRYDRDGQDITSTHPYYASSDGSHDHLIGQNPTPGTVRRLERRDTIGMALSDPEPYSSHVIPTPYAAQPSDYQQLAEQKRAQRARNKTPKPSEQWMNSSRPVGMEDDEEEIPPAITAAPVHSALWGVQNQTAMQSQHNMDYEQGFEQGGAGRGRY